MGIKNWLARVANLTTKIILVIDDYQILLYVVDNQHIISSQRFCTAFGNYLVDLDNALSNYNNTTIYILYHTLDESVALAKSPDSNKPTKEKQRNSSQFQNLQDIILIHKHSPKHENIYLHVSCKPNKNLLQVIDYLLKNIYPIAGIYPLLAINAILFHYINDSLSNKSSQYQIFYFHSKLGFIKQFIFKGKNLVSTKNLSVPNDAPQAMISNLIWKDVELTNGNIQPSEANQKNMHYTVISTAKFELDEEAASCITWLDFNKLNIPHEKLSKFSSFEETIVKYVIHNRVSAFSIPSISRFMLLQKLYSYSLMLLSTIVIIGSILVSTQIYRVVTKNSMLKTDIDYKQKLSRHEKRITHVAGKLNKYNLDVAQLNKIILLRNHYPFDLINSLIYIKNQSIKYVHFQYYGASDILGKSFVILDIRADNNLDKKTDRYIVNDISSFLRDLRLFFPYNNVKYLRVSNNNAQRNIPIEIKIIEPITPK